MKTHSAAFFAANQPVYEGEQRIRIKIMSKMNLEWIAFTVALNLRAVPVLESDSRSSPSANPTFGFPDWHSERLRYARIFLS
jgi:hypothetical protein